MNINKKLEKCLMQAYEEVYASIGVDFHQVKSAEHDFFMDYEVSEEDQSKILNRVMESYKLKPYYRKLVTTAFVLGCSPKYPKV